jgi:phosphoribosylformylglycinamidine cyclo-ligase
MMISYRETGVDLDAAEEINANLSARLGTGLFGGFVPASVLKRYEEPVLVSSMDGIGTKVRLAGELGRVAGLGEDIVHHCVNDIAVHGATPLFFLDYLAFHQLEPALVDEIVTAIAGACDRLGITLAGGETAEMPLVYPPGRFDIAGAIVGVTEQRDIVDGSGIAPGDVLFGLPSSGLHTNGYSLIQRLFASGEYSELVPELGTSLGEALLVPHRCYLAEIQTLLATGVVRGLAHITGGGIAGNLARILPPRLQAVIELPPPGPLFELIRLRGISIEEMRRVFNLGIGMVAVVSNHPPAHSSDTHSSHTRSSGALAPRDLGWLPLGRVEQCTEMATKVVFRERG